MQALLSILGVWGYSQISSSTIFPDKTPVLNSYDITSIQTSLFFTGEIKNENSKMKLFLSLFLRSEVLKKWKIGQLLYFLPISSQKYITRMIIIFCFISGLYLNYLAKSSCG
jgi:hypothetical protein